MYKRHCGEPLGKLPVVVCFLLAALWIWPWVLVAETSGGPSSSVPTTKPASSSPAKGRVLPPIPPDVKLPPLPKAIPADVQLAAMPDVKLKMNLERLVRWPSEKFIKSHLATRDRTAEFPSKWRDNNRSGKPISVGVMSLKDVHRSANGSVRLVLKQEWRLLRLKMLPLMNEGSPQLSTVWGRYDIEGQGVQVSQMRWVICVVIKPDWEKKTAEKDNPSNTAERTKFIKTVAEKFLRAGKELAHLPLKAKTLSMKPTNRPTTGPAKARHTFFEIDVDEMVKRKMTFKNNSRWIHLLALSTDGRSLCVWVAKRGPLAGSRVITSKDPWF